MPIRSYRVTIPVLIEDVARPNGLAIHDKLEIIVEAQNGYEAARALERHWNENLPQGLSIIRRFERCPEHMATRIEWTDPPEHAERVHRHMDGRFDGLDRDRGALRFTTWTDAIVGDVSTVIAGPTFEIPFEDISHVIAVEWHHEHFEGMDDIQRRLRVSVTGHFSSFNYEGGGVQITVPEAYVSRPYDGGLTYIAGPSQAFGT